MRCERSTRRVVAAMLIGLHGVVACGAPRRVPTGLAPGDVVRVTIRSDGTVKGRAAALRMDTLVVETDSGRAVVTVDSVARLQVRTGTHGNAGAGFLVGAIVGGAGLAGAAAAAGSESDDLTGLMIVAGGFFGFLIGGALGATIGSATRSDSWAEVPRSGLAQGWTYAVALAPEREAPAQDAIVRGPVTDPSSRITLAPRVRVVQSDGSVVELLDAWASADSVGGSAVPDTVAVSLARRDIARVLAPRGKHGHAMFGLGIGLVAGLVGGLLIGSQYGMPQAHYGGLGALIGAPVGLVIGVLAGGWVTSDDWVVVDLTAVMSELEVR